MRRFILLFIALPILSVAQQTYVPDDNFEAYLEANGMGNGIANDDYVTTANISGVTILEVYNQNIASLTGIEDFTALSYLDFSGNNLTSLDISNNTALELLGCPENLLTSLDVSNNTALVGLDFDENLLTSLDISNNIALTYLDCGDNQLSCLNAKNGNNINLFFYTVNNPTLTCIEVDDPAWSIANWTGIDPQTSFSTNCNYPLGCFSTPTSIQENTTNISIFPNPTNDLITLDINGYNGTIETQVYDLSGRLLETTNSTTINLKDYAKGVYVFRISYGDLVEELKVVKD